MEYLVYISTAKNLLDEQELTDILTISAQKNKAHEITGVLLYSQGTFVQVLEGNTEALEEVFSSITKDERHKNIIKLIHTSTEKRAFPAWSMGFKAINEDEMHALEGYFDPAKTPITSDHDHPGVAIIKTFLDTH